MPYVDGFVAAVPTANREIFKKHAEAAAAVFKEHVAMKLAMSPRTNRILRSLPQRQT
jgi:uncharacterized protein YbaA (DUF1428 family)